MTGEVVAYAAHELLELQVAHVQRDLVLAAFGRGRERGGRRLHVRGHDLAHVHAQTTGQRPPVVVRQLAPTALDAQDLTEAEPRRPGHLRPRESPLDAELPDPAPGSIGRPAPFSGVGHELLGGFVPLRAH